MKRAAADAVLLLTVAAGGLWTGIAFAEDWSHWRGPTRNGIANERSGWDGAKWDLRRVWEAQLGVGASSPLIIDGRLYTLSWSGQRDRGEDRLECFDAATGKVSWRHSYPAPAYGRHSTGDKGLYRGICATPEYDPATGLLYTLGVDGDLRCWNTRDQGKPVWALNLYDEFQMPQRQRVNRSGLRDYGYTSSPLLWKQWLIVEAGSPRRGCLVALDKSTGRFVWGSQSKEAAGHNAGPAPVTIEGVPCAAVHTFEGLLVVRFDAGREGRTVAHVPWKTDFANNIASVCVHDDSVLLTSEYNQHRTTRFRLSLKGAEPVWTVAEASNVCTPVVHQGHVYFASKQLTCLDWETGQKRWSGGRFGDAGSCIATSDNRLLVWGGRGDLVLAECFGRSPKAYRPLAQIRGVGSSDAWPHVGLSQGRIYCKDRQGKLVCFATR